MTFSLRTTLLGFGLIAFWCATFGINPYVGHDLRQSIVWIIFAAGIASAICFRAGQRAFWVGFSCVQIVYAFSFLRNGFELVVPSFFWVDNLARQMADTPGGEAAATYFPIKDSLTLLCIVGLSVLTGVIARAIYITARKAL